MIDIEKKNRRILIIDDNEAIHKDFRAILEGDNSEATALDEVESAVFGTDSEVISQNAFEIDSAFQGQEGLEMVRQAMKDGRPYAMAFVDVRMPPGWDGVETICRIWQEYPQLQVVICTAYSDYQWKDLVRKLGQSEQLLVLKKPFDNIEAYQLASALTEKWYLGRQAHLKQKELEQIVKQRTLELEQANDQLTVALEEAEKSNKAKREFLANIGHELRTPMNSIIGFSDVLSSEDLTDAQREYVDYISKDGKNLMGLIDNILDVSIMESGELRVKCEDCSLEEIIAYIDYAVRPAAQEKDLDFEIIQCTALPAIIKTDAPRLRQSLVNLAINAVKFTEQGCVYIRVSFDDSNDCPIIRFDIEDEGIGIPEDKIQTIFNSFEQVDGSASRKFEGAGLGLSITEKLTKLLGGDITVTSKLNKGSVFTLTIPAGLSREEISAQPLIELKEAMETLKSQV